MRARSVPLNVRVPFFRSFVQPGVLRNFRDSEAVRVRERLVLGSLRRANWLASATLSVGQRQCSDEERSWKLFERRESNPRFISGCRARSLRRWHNLANERASGRWREGAISMTGLAPPSSLLDVPADDAARLHGAERAGQLHVQQV